MNPATDPATQVSQIPGLSSLPHNPFYARPQTFSSSMHGGGMVPQVTPHTTSAYGLRGGIGSPDVSGVQAQPTIQQVCMKVDVLAAQIAHQEARFMEKLEAMRLASIDQIAQHEARLVAYLENEAQLVRYLEAMRLANTNATGVPNPGKGRARRGSDPQQPNSNLIARAREVQIASLKGEMCQWALLTAFWTPGNVDADFWVPVLARMQGR